MRFDGVFTAIVTPMSGGAIDEGGLRALVRQQLAGGIDGLVVCGSTGEAATLSADEQAAALTIVVAEVAGRAPVIAGVGARSTWEAIEEARRGEALGADALLVVTPAYNKPPQAGLVAHFEAVADAVGKPIILYNVPGRTAVDLLPPAVRALASHPRVVAIKEATGSLVRAAELRTVVPELTLLSGDDPTLLPFFALGGHGTISVLSNVVPDRVVALHRAARDGRNADAQALFLALLPLAEALFVESNPIPVKTALQWIGVIPSAELRLPLVPLTEHGGDRLERAMRDAGLPLRRSPGAPSRVR